MQRVNHFGRKRGKFHRYLSAAKTERAILIADAAELGIPNAEQLESKDLTRHIALARIRNQ